MNSRPWAVVVAAVGLGWLALRLAGCGGDESATSPPSKNHGSQAGPSQVSGYGNCTAPSCTDVARACDDLIRSGCAKTFAGDGPAKPEPGSKEFENLLLNCTLISHHQLSEARETVGEENEEEESAAPVTAPEVALRHAMAVGALEAARCTRRATTCQERLDCLRGKTIAARAPFPDAGAEPDGVSPIFEEPIWAKPWEGTGPDPLWAGPPWVDAGGKANVYLVPGVDSPSCARCAIERCPGFAYLCFSAQGDSDKCSGDDCCEGLRRCVVRQGGYASSAAPVDYYKALALCEVGRPHAAQQLADLQGCAAVACEGCEAMDKNITVTDDGDGGLVREGGP